VGSSEPAESCGSEEHASWEEQEAAVSSLKTQDAGEETPLSCQPRIQSLGDAERLLDELTQEKQQVIVGYFLLLHVVTLEYSIRGIKYFKINKLNYLIM